ncbi:MAG: hypothetical protein KJ893_06770 [Candidatus Omnitrophica bacterium]|nr:hypothetical protein [Candidatus Omnitrophota bacterium]MCG2703746.1 hypothetical protein [Candidatus Omnitrophota bacterium]
MKKIKWLIAVFIPALIMAVNVQAQSMEADLEEEELVGVPAKFVDGIFGVYIDRGSRMNHYIPSGWMGDYGDIKLDENCKEKPYSGVTCIKFSYSAQGKQGANWAGVFWQNPPNNWGEKKGGFDIRGAKKITFWARGEAGDERIQEFKAGGISGTYPDSDSAGIGPVDLTSEWQQYTIDLSDVDLSYISGGFCWATNADSNPQGCTFYLDDIRYEQ